MNNTPDYWLGELLAIIHRDGGHYRAEHPLPQATFDAINKHLNLRCQVSDLEAEVARLKYQLGITRNALRHFASVWGYGDCAWATEEDGYCRFDWESILGAAKTHAEALKDAGFPFSVHPLHQEVKL